VLRSRILELLSFVTLSQLVLRDFSFILFQTDGEELSQ
jgi:hypothetical protein